MGDIQIVLNDDNASVYIDGKHMGMIAYSTNPYHGEHYYLKLQLQYYDMEASTAVFSWLHQKLDKPMQVMILSGEEDVVSFIRTAGFCCKRKCYEIEASAQDYIGRKMNCQLPFATVGYIMYERCCETMLDRYVLTHAEVSPWTGSKEDFFAMLPSTAYYEVDNEQIKNIAFVEGNEIAYVHGTDIDGFTVFAQKLITELFGQNDSIFFEADNCDEYAMELRKLFVNQSEETFDTYIL